MGDFCMCGFFYQNIHLATMQRKNTTIMKPLFALCIFCVVLFLYLHIQFHYKTGEDLEMYEVERPSKSKLEDVCDVRQPVLFDFEESEQITQYTSRDFLLTQYSAFEIKVRNIRDTQTDNEWFIPLPFHDTETLFQQDTMSQFYSENNEDFLQETGIIKHFQYNDAFLRPSMMSNKNYDILLGSSGTHTPFRYELNYRNYFMVSQGSVAVKLSPPKSSRHLLPQTDYEHFEFYSTINPWNPQKEYLADFQKIKCLEFTLMPGKVLFIPAFWWYSFQFQNRSSISCFRYRTFMNNLAISPYLGMYALQNLNIERQVSKKVDLKSEGFKKGEKKKGGEAGIHLMADGTEGGVQEGGGVNTGGDVEQTPDVDVEQTPNVEPSPDVEITGMEGFGGKAWGAKLD